MREQALGRLIEAITSRVAVFGQLSKFAAVGWE